MNIWTHGVGKTGEKKKREIGKGDFPIGAKHDSNWSIGIGKQRIDRREKTGKAKGNGLLPTLAKAKAGG
ncbi:hypothetical protein ACFX11_025332 [Malus domestica]